MDSVFTLFHKNVPVLRFRLSGSDFPEIIDFLNKEHCPVGVFRDFQKGVSKSEQFRNWWKGRSIPSSRQGLREALESLGNLTTEDLLAKAYGLSLSDTYWAKPENTDIKWEEINFFENPFSEDVGKALFGTLDLQSIGDISFVSPDNTSDGWLQKKWIIDNGSRVLLKGGSGTEQQEPFNEVLASELCKRLEIPHVEYAIVEQNHRYYSACRNFTDSNSELVSALYVYNSFPVSNNESAYQHLLNCCEKLGMNKKNIEESICHMIIVDSLILNTDRHFNNFGFLRNPETLEWKGLAPIYDSGTSMLHNISVPVLKLNADYEIQNLKSKPFYKNFAEQLKKLPCRDYFCKLNFDKLKGIEDFFGNILSKNINISHERSDILCGILNEQIRIVGNILKFNTVPHGLLSNSK